MIELANKASRSFPHSAAANDPDREQGPGARPTRTGHAWPFLSRYSVRPVQRENSQKPAANDSGS
jgi:hypothetical protein